MRRVWLGCTLPSPSQQQFSRDIAAVETFLNLIWLVIALGALGVWRYRWLPSRLAPRSRALPDFVALICALALLFPSISLTDDLHPVIVAVDAASGKRNGASLLARASQPSHAAPKSRRSRTRSARARCGARLNRGHSASGLRRRLSSRSSLFRSSRPFTSFLSSLVLKGLVPKVGSVFATRLPSAGLTARELTASGCDQAVKATGGAACGSRWIAGYDPDPRVSTQSQSRS